MSDGDLVKHWADEFNEISDAKDARLSELEKQLAERDAALARCVEAAKERLDMLVMLRKAVKPFHDIAAGTAGRIPTERLSAADWHKLWKAYQAPPPKDNGTGPKYWDLDAACEAHASLVNCYEALTALKAEVAAEEALTALKAEVAAEAQRNALLALARELEKKLAERDGGSTSISASI